MYFDWECLLTENESYKSFNGTPGTIVFLVEIGAYRETLLEGALAYNKGSLG